MYREVESQMGLHIGWEGPCLVDGCDTAASCRGMCAKHYQRWHRTGSPVRQRRLTHAEVATAAKADALVVLWGSKILTRSERSMEVLGITADDIRAALARRKPRMDMPRAERRGRNRGAPTGMKWCSRCKRMLPLDQFSRNRLTKDGHQSECARCIRGRKRSAK